VALVRRDLEGLLAEVEFEKVIRAARPKIANSNAEPH
jgi:hypothetical protein